MMRRLCTGAVLACLLVGWSRRAAPIAPLLQQVADAPFPVGFLRVKVAKGSGDELSTTAGLAGISAAIREQR